jgi:hypothetical protein
MAKTWILDTSTKGTGATMVPLEHVLRKRAESPEPIYVPPPRRPKPSAPSGPRAPRSFKVVDVTTRQVLTEGAGAHAAIEVLNDVRSIVDVNIYVWQPKTERWRLLSFDEQRLLWDRRDPSAGGPAAAAASS